METDEHTKHFGLLTSISMVIGIVIGSGIFFKTDDILMDTNGNILLGVVALVLGALGIIFGGLSFSQLAKTSDKAGGVVTYAELAINKTFSFFVGFIQMNIYFPTLTAIVCFVAADYTLLLFPHFHLNVWVVTLCYLFTIFLLNYHSKRLSAFFQTSATIIKLIPLILIGFIGIMFGDPSSISDQHITVPLIISSSSAIVAVAFSYDGWTIATGIAHEIKNSKRNLPIALSVAPLIIMSIYLIYFVGMSSILGPKTIIALGDAHVSKVATMYFGSIGNKLILITIIISVLGTTNGLFLGGSRIPYSLALRNQLPCSEWIKKVDDKNGVPKHSLIMTLCYTSGWLLIHYLSLHVKALHNLDISSLPIVIMYCIFAIIFVGIIYRFKMGVYQGVVSFVVFPFLAIIGCACIIYGGVASPAFPLYSLITFAFIFLGVIIYKNQAKK